MSKRWRLARSLSANGSLIIDSYTIAPLWSPVPDLLRNYRRGFKSVVFKSAVFKSVVFKWVVFKSVVALLRPGSSAACANPLKFKCRLRWISRRRLADQVAAEVRRPSWSLNRRASSVVGLLHCSQGGAVPRRTFASQRTFASRRTFASVRAFALRRAFAPRRIHGPAENLSRH